MARILEQRWYGREYTLHGAVHHISAHRAAEPKIIDRHTLPCWELGVVERGVLRIATPDGESRGGQVAVIPPNVEQWSPAGSHIRAAVYWLGIDPKGEDARFPAVPLADSEAEALEAVLDTVAGSVVALPPVVLNAVRDCFEVVHGQEHPLIRRGSCSVVLGHLLQTLGSTTSDSIPDRVAPAVSLMLEDLKADWDLKELAQRCGMGRTNFAATFREETGFSPRDWLLEQRIAQAEDALDHSQESIIAVAHNCGFSTPQYFATVFKRLRGVTPSEWRARKESSNG